MDEAGFAKRMEELYREAHSANVRRGRQRKIEQGGLPGCAPVGYVNRREGDRTWVEVDPVKGPLVREAFELAATGRYSLRQLLSVITAKGLTSRNCNPMGVSALRWMLSNVFYLGTVRIGTQTHVGEHTPLINGELFERVQTFRLSRSHLSAHQGENEPPPC
jgi:hypothetical protein